MMIKTALLLVVLAVFASQIGPHLAVEGPEEVGSFEAGSIIPGINEETIEGKPSMVQNFVNRQAYKMINKHISRVGIYLLLKRKQKSVIDRAAIDDAAKWMESLRSDPKKSRNRIGKLLLQALNQFTSLRDIDGENRCNSHSYNILLQNDYATGGVAHVKDEDFFFALFVSFIDGIVHDYGIKHALECRAVYLAEFERRRVQLDLNLIGKIESYIGRIRDSSLDKNKHYEDAIREVVFHDKTKRVSHESRAKIAREFVESQGKDGDLEAVELLSSKGANKDKLEPLVERYFIKPCRYYVENLGPGLIEPAIYDKRVLSERNFYRNQGPGEVEFVKAIDNYRLCSKLITDGGKNEMIATLATSTRLPPILQERSAE